jgi:acetolactate synthase I/II/III large subunit
MAATVAVSLALALKRHNIEVVFAQSLPTAVILACEDLGIRQLAYRQENMGGAMADGYSRISGRISVVAAQNGPAAALLVAPLAEALKASVAVVALVQDVERHHADRNAFQELDHLQLFSACSKWARRLPTADRVDDYVDMALTAAGGGRPGPAVLLLPADLLRENAAAPLVQRRLALGCWPLDRYRPADDVLMSAARRIADARSPVVLAGGGVASATARAALARLQETAHLPVITTNMGKGVVAETHALSCGVLGSLNGPRSLGRHMQALLQEADVILLVGTRTNQNGTDSWRNLPGTAALIQIDIDPQEIGRNYEALRLTGEAGTTLEALCDCLERLDLGRRLAARPGLASRIARCWRGFDDERAVMLSSNAGPVRPERVMAELQKQLSFDTVVVADASYSSMWMVGQLRSTSSGQRFICPRGLAGIGWGLPLAIGAKVARPQSRVVAIVGDGGFAHGWAELETLARARLGVKVIVLSNGILGYQKHAECVKFGSYTSACHLSPVDHAMIATACGCKVARIDQAEDIGGALAAAMADDDPWLVDVVTDPDSYPPLSLFERPAARGDRQPLPA